MSSILLWWYYKSVCQIRQHLSGWYIANWHQSTHYRAYNASQLLMIITTKQQKRITTTIIMIISYHGSHNAQTEAVFYFMERNHNYFRSWRTSSSWRKAFPVGIKYLWACSTFWGLQLTNHQMHEHPQQLFCGCTHNRFDEHTSSTYSLKIK